MVIRIFDAKTHETVVAGNFIENQKVFMKRVTQNHYIHDEGGYGIHVDALRQLKDLKCKKIRLRTDTLTYETPLEPWLKIKPKNRGNGDFAYMNIKNMAVIERDGARVV